MNTDPRIDEILEDINTVEYSCTKAEKLPIVDKYNLKTYKIVEIKHELLKIANDYRKEHTVYTKQDFIIWNRLWNYPASMQKIRLACEGEDMDWIDHCIKLVDNPKNYKDRRYEYFYKLKEEKINSQDTRLQNIYENLTIITFEFKKKLYEHYLFNEKHRFEYYSQYKELNDELKSNKHFASSWIKIKAMSENFNWDIFKRKIDNNFETMFDGNIKEISKRINANKKINTKTLRLVSIDEDAKFFEMMLKDAGGHTVHCRSIIAAEFSELVSTHYRFIITIK